MRNIKKGKCKICCPDGGAIFKPKVNAEGRFWECQNCLTLTKFKPRKRMNAEVKAYFDTRLNKSRES